MTSEEAVAGTGAGARTGKVELPSEEELATLPRRAAIAFAGRCARRVHPLVKHFWPDAPHQHVESLSHAITLVEASAVGPVRTSDLESASHAATRAYHASHASGTASGAAAYAAAGAYASDVTLAAAHAAAGADAASASADGRPAIRAAMRRDYDLLKAAAEYEKWTDETPVPPEFFGPLWPGGEPDGWPVEDEDENICQAALRLHFSIPAEMDRDEADRIVQEIIIAANELHLVYGGSGLTIADRPRVHEPALVPAGGDE